MQLKLAYDGDVVMVMIMTEAAVSYSSSYVQLSQSFSIGTGNVVPGTNSSL
jgi:hypothetical protein